MIRLAMILRLAMAGAVLAGEVMAGEVIIDAKTGRQIAGVDADRPRFPASTTKLMTIFVALEAADLGEVDLAAVVRISKHAAAAPPVKLGLKAGDTIRLSDAIHAALILSSNDAARVIAEAVSVSEEAFARRMTETARVLGMQGTTFRNASGLPDARHISTAADIARLMLALDRRHGAYLRPLFHAPLGWRGGAKRPRNGTVASVAGARLGKTGFTCAAGYTAAVLIENAEGARAIATLANSGRAPRAASLRRLAKGGVAAHDFASPCKGGGPGPAARLKPALASLGDWSLTLGVYPEKQSALAALTESRQILPGATGVLATRRSRQGYYALVLADDRDQARRLQDQLASGGMKAGVIDRSGRLTLGLEAHSRP